MKLYYYPGACSLAPHIISKEIDVPLELVKVDLMAHPRMADGQLFTEVNLKNSVPALMLDDGHVLTENSVILQYLAGLAPDDHLLPADGLGRWRVLEAVSFVATEIHKTRAQLYDPANDDAARGRVIERLGMKLASLDAQLGDKKFLAGDNFTIADAYAFVTCDGLPMFGIDFGQWPRLNEYMERVAARDAVKSAQAAEGAAH